MPLKIEHHEPTKLPAPLSLEQQRLRRTHLKVLGISPAIDNGIRTWRVIWRETLKTPIPYTRPDGRPGLKRKGDMVHTRRYPVVGDTTEEQAFRLAAMMAAAAYGTRMSLSMPIVDWDQLARIKGVKIRKKYAKPSLNGDMDIACELFQAGYNNRQVAEQLGVNPSTACRWRQRLRKENALP